MDLTVCNILITFRSNDNVNKTQLRKRYFHKENKKYIYIYINYHSLDVEKTIIRV